MSEPIYHKITHGCVIQTFNKEGKVVYQNFRADDIVEYEQQTDIVKKINITQMPLGGMEYFSFDMIQPK